ncbi:MAG: PD40 domain-containing protein [Acidobacteria bacterium]|nr:PD40 domain-containing protein [Acidobacteriota bacterium]
MSHRIPLALLFALLSAGAFAQTQATPSPPDTEIYLAPLTAGGATLSVGRPVNITNSPGYDNQPSFRPDGGAILFTSIRGGTQTDIYRYDIASGATERVTNTPESEYSPTVTPDGAHISVIRVEADGTQRLWQFPRFALPGAAPELVLKDVKPVGYHTWIDDHTLALFVLGQPATLQIADARTGAAEVVVRGINRSIQRIPGRGTISFVEQESDASNADAKLWIRELDPKARRVTPLVAAVAGAKEADLAWTPDGMLLMAEKDVLYGWRRGETEWRRIADLTALGLHGVSRIAVSPKGDRVAFVATP